jgi:hypothetical protein
MSKTFGMRRSALPGLADYLLECDMGRYLVDLEWCCEWLLLAIAAVMNLMQEDTNLPNVYAV